MDGVSQCIDLEVLDKHCKDFLNKTQLQDGINVNPGGYYKAIWARDASFILMDQLLTGDLIFTLEQISMIWSNQIGTEASPSLLKFSNSERKPLLYGRGSPELDFSTIVAGDDLIKKFEGALPTTIYHEKGFCEVYGQNPDIDSTVLMIHVTCWSLAKSIERAGKDDSESLSINTSSKPIDLKVSNLKSPFFDITHYELYKFLIPRMLKAVRYLESRDIDGDGLLEQKHNEDWMDTLLRTGRVVYSQACWILALKSLSNLLLILGNHHDARNIQKLVNKSILAVEEILWSSDEQCYIDLLDSDLHLDEKMYNRMITQDISLYLVALTEGHNKKFFQRIRHFPEKSTQYDEDSVNSEIINYMALCTLDTLKRRIWKYQTPLVTEREITKTGPWVLKANEYHNHTFWSWITGIEMISRNRYGKIPDFHYLFSKFISSNKIHSNMLHEWVDPITFEGNGANPFRTGISSIRIAVLDYMGKRDVEPHPLVN